MTADRTWELAAHLRHLNLRLLEVADGSCRRLIVTMPPRSGKSLLISRYFPAWYIGRFPDRRVILASYEATFAASFGRKARDVLEELGEAVFGITVGSDSRAADHWEIDGSEGGMITAGTGGPIPGRGADLLVIDDPTKSAEEASSAHMRDVQWDWFASTAYPRLQPDGAIVIVTTRWHEDDLVGRLLRGPDAKEWRLIRFPAIAEESDELGRREGEALWPSRFPLPVLEATRRAIGSHWFAALYQGRPAPAEGAIFKREWIKRWLPKGEHGYLAGGEVCDWRDLVRFATVDLASSKSASSDYTVIATFGMMPSGKLLLLDVIRRRMDGPEIVAAVKSAVASSKLHLVFAETTVLNMQTAFVQILQHAGLPIRGFRADRSKELRAMAATPFMEQGRLYLPMEAPWLQDIEHEMFSFPHAEHDDMVDCLTMGCLVAIQHRVRAHAREEPDMPYDAIMAWHTRGLHGLFGKPRMGIVCE